MSFEYLMIGCYLIIVLSLAVISYTVYAHAALSEDESELFRQIDWRLM